MQKDKVSVIIPVYNAEKYIGQTIESVLNQTYKNLEILVFDDNSKDESLKILKEYSAKDTRIKVINSEKNLGVVNARNKLTYISTGEFIAYLDSDDYWEMTKIEKQLAFMKKMNAEISCTEYTRIDENNKKINEINIKEKINYEDMLKNNYLGCLTVMYDVGKIGKRYFKDRQKNEDYVLWLEIIKEVKFVYGLKENLAFYRVLGNSRSSNKIKAAEDRWNIYRKVEKLSLTKSIYYFLNYVVKALKKSK